MVATDQQVQAFVDQRIRVRAEQIRALYNALNDDISAIDDVYAAVSAPTPTWVDNRTDGPPHLLTPSDVLAMNTLFHAIRDAIAGNAQLPIALKACVRAI